MPACDSNSSMCGPPPTLPRASSDSLAALVGYRAVAA